MASMVMARHLVCLEIQSLHRYVVYISRIFFVCTRYSSNQFGPDSCIFSNYIHTLVICVRAVKMLYLLMFFLVQPENSDCRNEREACGDHAQCVYQVGETKKGKTTETNF